jgi:SAM-dependent methyltransferase
MVERAVVEEAAELIISKFEHTWAYQCQFRFALAVCQRAYMHAATLQAPSLEIGINDGSSATIARFGRPKFTYGGDMPEANTYESMGLHLDPHLDVYENVIGMDAHGIPFPDESFNAIVTNDMLSYGVDRAKIVREIVRVLAPGGTIFLSETTGNLNKYPYILAELRKWVPTVHTLDDSVAFYRRELEALGMINIEGRTYFDHRLCAVTLDTLYRGELKNEIDASKRGFHEEGLRGLAGLLADELETVDNGRGWQIFTASQKPGPLIERPIPKPMCLSCNAPLVVELTSCTCPACGLQYRSEFGNPYVLADYGKAYSPKREFVHSVSTQIVEKLLDQLVDRLHPGTSLSSWIGQNLLGKAPAPADISIFGFDKSTRFMIRFLKARDIDVSTIYTTNPLFSGHEVLGVPIRLIEDIRHAEQIVISIYCQPQEVADLLSAGHEVTVLQADVSADTWHSPPRA